MSEARLPTLIVGVVSHSADFQTFGGEIIAVGLRKRFGAVEAVQAVDFTARPGRITGLLGANGAGKSTVLRMLVGLVVPDAGRATIGGHAYAEHAEPLGTAGFVAEDVRFHPARTGRQSLAIVAAAAGRPHAEIGDALELVGLTQAGARAVGGYSLGMRQRLALAAALLPEPAVLLLDEPMNGLDPPGVVWLRELLARQAAEGRTVLVSSHLLGEMEQIIDDAVIIAEGRTLVQQPLVDLLGGATVEVSAPRLEDLAGALRVAGCDVAQQGALLLVHGHDAADVGDVAAKAGISLDRLTTHRRTLEDAYLVITESVPR